MTEREKIMLEFMKIIVPKMLDDGLTLQKRIMDAGGSLGCKVGGKDIPHAYAESARVWAEAFTDEFIDTITQNNK